MATLDASAVDSSAGPQDRPHIRAQPAVVQVRIQRDPRTTIFWDAGDNVEAEVFVSRNGQAEVLFAKGVRGAEVVAPIAAGAIYVFKLYGAPERKSLLDTVTVRGVATALPTGTSGDGVPVFVRWILLICAAGVFFLGTMHIARPGKTAAEHTIRSPHGRLRIARPLLGGAALFFGFDAVIFHTGLYNSILSPVSFAGEVKGNVQRENQRAASGLREVLLLGDSRMGRGFDPNLAERRAANQGFKFINLAVRGSSPRVWSYLLREIDPRASRYAAIVMPVEYADTDRRPDAWKHLTDFDLHFVAPLLRYTDAFEFAASFPEWTARCQAFAACLFRGYAFQTDLLDLLAHPITRLQQLRWARQPRPANAFRAPRDNDENLVGIVYDEKTDELRVPPHIRPSREASLRQMLYPPANEEKGHWITHRTHWVGGIIERYTNSGRAVVLMQMPRGPVVRRPRSAGEEQSSVSSLVKNNRTILLDEGLFRFLEKPEYFFDGLHLNTAGRQEFTERLVEELIARLPPR